MKQRIFAIGILSLVLVIAVAISGCTSTPQATTSEKTVQPQTTTQTHADTQNGGGNPQSDGQNRFSSQMMKQMVQNLTTKGYDLTQIQAALDKGDEQTARKLLTQFWDQHPEVRPAIPVDRIKGMVQNLSAKGYDTKDIQAAVDSGDGSKASALLNQFFQAHPEARPTFTADPAQLSSRIERLKQQGVDVTDIEKAYVSGDMNKTRDLIRQASPQKQQQ